MTTLLHVRNATRRYRRGHEVVHALAGVDLEVRAGELVALLGPSGSGKTTLLHALAGWEALDGGALAWSTPVTDPARWDQVAVVPQRLGLLDELTVGDNVRWPARLAGRQGGSGLRARVDGLLAALALSDLAGRYPDEVSLGQQQRTAVARALVLDPPVVLADEPTGHQDADAGRRVYDTLLAACRRGTAVVVATHDLRVLDHADRVLRLRDGAPVPAEHDERGS